MNDRMLVYGAVCASCGTEMEAYGFTGGKQHRWPVACTLEVTTSDLIHPDCGGRLDLVDARRMTAIEYMAWSGGIDASDLDAAIETAQQLAFAQSQPNRKK